MRDIIKTAEKGRGILNDHPRADLILSETAKFVELFEAVEKDKGQTDAVLKVMSVAFDMGIAVGYRIARK